MERLKAELAEAKAVIKTTLPAKERQICELTRKFSDLVGAYQEEVADHRRTRSDLQTKDAEIRKLKEQQGVVQPPPSPVTISSTSNSNSASVFNNVSNSRSERIYARARVNTAAPVLPKTIERAMKTGSDILYRGYGCPRRTAVPECTAPDGHHYFSGKGSNQYAKRYTCTICRFSCSEK